MDIRGWIAGGAPGARYIQHAVREGKWDFSVTAEGPWNNPEGSGRLLFRGLGAGVARVSDGEAEISLRAHVLRLERLRAGIWGGGLEADGVYNLESGRMEGKASLKRVSLAAVPLRDLGVPASLAGTADAAARVAGTPDRFAGTVSLSFPGGVERLPSPGTAPMAIRFPISFDASGSIIERDVVKVDSYRLSAGKAELHGDGDASLTGRRGRLKGSVSLPAGKASDYGLEVPLSWGKAGGNLELSGPVARPHLNASISAMDFAFRSLPPVPVTVKLDGVPEEALHFVADVPAPTLKITAVGTVVAPFDRSRAKAEITLLAREVDLADSARWVSAISASLGADPGEASRLLAGVEGTGAADGRIGVSAGTLDVKGNFRAPAVTIRGVPVKSLHAEGEYRDADGGTRWSALSGGMFGNGSFRLAANGSGGKDTLIEGSLEGIELSQVFSVLRRGDPWGAKGPVDARFTARKGPRGWESPRFTAGAKEIGLGTARISGVRAEGSLGAEAGTFTLRTDSPRTHLEGEVTRTEGWPAKVKLAVTEVPASFLFAAMGRSTSETPVTGAISGEGGGVIRLGDLAEGRTLTPAVFPDLYASLRGGDLSIGELRFGECRVDGRKRGDVFEGEVLTHAPDSRLSWSVSLRDPFSFRLEGPFALGETGKGTAKNGSGSLSVRGRVEIEGALRDVAKTRGTLLVESLVFRDGDLDLTGKDLSARMDQGGIQWTGGTVLTAGSPVRISGKVSWGGDLDVRLEGKLPAAAVRLAVPGVFDRLDGTMTVEARITGNRVSPSIVGTGHLEGGTILFIGYNQLFEGIRADAILSREKIVFEHFEGKSGGGYIDGWGEVPLKMDAGQRLYFSVDFLDVRYPYPEEFRPVIQGHAELLGPVDDLLITGDVEVQSARYTKTLRPEKALVDFGKRLADVSARREKSEFRIRFDINAIADGTIRIRNNLADAVVKGDFRIVGDTSRVIILGSFDVVEGTVDFSGNKYEIKRATVDFQDPRRNNPRLDARAETKKGNITVTVLVTGTLDKSEVDFTSDPPLGKNDIVSLLSLGVTTHALAGQEGAVGSAAAASIALGPYKGGVEEGIRGAVGLDRFAVEPGFSSTTKTFEPKFIVGKSFGERASVSVSSSVGTSAESTATAEYKLRENIYLQGGWQSATTTQEGDLGADLKFRFRYPQWKDFLRGKE